MWLSSFIELMEKKTALELLKHLEIHTRYIHCKKKKIITTLVILYMYVNGKSWWAFTYKVSCVKLSIGIEKWKRSFPSIEKLVLMHFHILNKTIQSRFQHKDNSFFIVFVRSIFDGQRIVSLEYLKIVNLYHLNSNLLSEKLRLNQIW